MPLTRQSLEPFRPKPRLMRDVFSGCEDCSGIGRGFSSARRARTLVGNSGSVTKAPFFSRAWRLGLILFGVALTLAWLGASACGTDRPRLFLFWPLFRSSPISGQSA